MEKRFIVKIGAIFEASKVRLHLWLQAVVLMTGSKKGFSAHQLHRTIGVTYKTAWFMAHRIREAMRSGDLAPFSGTVEVDETFIGIDSAEAKGRKGGYGDKMKVLSLVNRQSGQARSYVVDTLSKKEIVPILQANIDREAFIFTDEASQYRGMDEIFRLHGVVNHERKEWARGTVHTNAIEGYFLIFKRGMKGVYQHCAKRHLHRYMAKIGKRQPKDQGGDG